MKEVTLFEVTQQKILVEDGSEYIEYARMLEPQHRIIGSPDAEYMVHSEFEVHTLPIKRLAREVTRHGVYHEVSIHQGYYYALTPEAEKFMRVSGYYEEHVALKKLLKRKLRSVSNFKSR